MRWVKEPLFNEFNIKNLVKVKVIIELEIIRHLEVKTLKINQKT